MLEQCPLCQKELKLSSNQIDKIENALKTLSEGKFLKIGCPHCKQSIKLDQSGKSIASDSGQQTAGDSAAKSSIIPPEPPDISWLEEGTYETREIVDDIPQVLMLIKDPAIKIQAIEAFAELGYVAVEVDSADEAIERMQFETYRGVVYQIGFEGENLDECAFHGHMSGMAMTKRRYIYYVILGPGLRTLYDLEALAYSANMVVNEKDATHFKLLLRKGLNDYERLFGPLLSTMKEVGKK